MRDQEEAVKAKKEKRVKKVFVSLFKIYIDIDIDIYKYRYRYRYR